MKRLFLVLLFLLCPLSLRAQNVALSGNVQDITGVPVTLNDFFRLRLRNYSGFVPKVDGTAIILPACGLPNTVCKDFFPNGGGVLSGTIYGNDQITPPGTYYTGEFWQNGKIAFSCDYLITGTSWNLNTAACLSQATPVGPNQLITQAFTCSVFSASTTWVCTHNLNDTNVQVSSYDLSNRRIFPDTLTVTSPNVVTITWVVPQAGNAVIVHAGAISIATNQPNAVVQNPTAPQSICCFPLTLSAAANFNAAATFSVPWVSTVSTGTAAFTIASTTLIPNLNAQLLGGFGAPSSAIVGVNDTQTLTNKTFDLSANTLKNATNTAGNVPRNNGTIYVDATLAATDLANGVTGGGAVVLATNASLITPTLTSPAINGASTGTGVQGTDTKLLSAGTVSGTSALLCSDANGGATTASCPQPAVVQSVTTPTLGGDISYTSGNTTNVLSQAITMPSSGGPFRAMVCYGVYYTTPASATAANFWVDDGTNQFASSESGSGISPVPTQGTGACGVSTTAGYSNGANITFTLKVKGNQNLTIRQLPTNSGGQNSWMSVAVLPSVN